MNTDFNRINKIKYEDKLVCFTISIIGTYHHKVGSSILSVSDEGYSRNVSCALNLISTFLFESRSWRGVLDTTLCEKCLLVTWGMSKNKKLSKTAGPDDIKSRPLSELSPAFGPILAIFFFFFENSLKQVFFHRTENQQMSRPYAKHKSQIYPWKTIT
jgi:hypothetical protein